jgi:hypothetical protein
MVGFDRAGCRFLGERGRLGTIPSQNMKIPETWSSGYLGEALIRAFSREKTTTGRYGRPMHVRMPKFNEYRYMVSYHLLPAEQAPARFGKYIISATRPFWPEELRK